MKTSFRALLPLAGLAAWLAGQPARADTLPDLVITHLGGNGQLSFTPVAGYTNYTVEWAPTVNGPWSDDWLALRQISPQSSTQTVSVPMFYRVVARGTPVVVPDGLAYVPFGAFLMGDNFGIASDATPVHLVEISAFFIERREVARALWDSVAAWATLRGYDFSGPSSASPTNHPVNEIEWYDAVKWCNARSEKEGLNPVYFTSGALTNVYRSGMLDLTNGCVNWSANGYRLPTEAEWERAARGGLEGQQYPWGGSNAAPSACIQGDYANYWNSGDPYDNDTTPVGFYNGAQSIGGQDMANGFGLYDMAGNVAEICWDRYATYPTAPQLDPHGPDSGDYRVRRGGSWYDSINLLRCAARQQLDPWMAAPNIGLRCVRKPE
jgi:formylglycine-generating enzyme required for sulfatase activity